MSRDTDIPSQSLLTRLGLDTKPKRAWAYYDIANSGFAAVIMVAILPIYFADVVASELPAHQRSSLWASITTVAMIATAALSPFLGNISDFLKAKKRFLLVTTAVGALSCIALAWSGRGAITFTAITYIAANMSFALGNVFYEALLVDVADDESIHTTSTSGYALGYLASGLLLCLNLAWVLKPETFGFSDAGAAIQASFISVGIWWAIFSIPLFTKVKEKGHRTEKASHNDVANIVRFSGRRLIATFKDIKKLPNLFLFLLAFWFYSDGIGTIIKMATIYGKEVGIGNNDLMAAIVVVQFVGVPCSFLFGPLAIKIGPKNGLYITLLVYLVLTFLAYFMTTATEFWILAVGLATVQGASQALSRSIFSRMLPASRSGEFFGFYSVSSKFAGIIGPLAFGIITAMAGASRLAILFIVALFLLGIAILYFVDLEEGIKQATEADSFEPTS